MNKRSEVLQCLADGVSRLTTTDAWQRYLDCQSRFHSYSFGNVLLIVFQRPDATRVAGFHTWRKLNRTVRRGEKALWIMAPMASKVASSIEGGGDDEIDGRAVWGFRPVPVFDISQTDGQELPTVCRRLHGDDPDGCYARLADVARSCGFTVKDHQFASGTNGDCNHRTRCIRVESRNALAQRVKTLAHELAHAVLHEQAGERAVAELEAESTAYVVCQSLGIDTSDYSFGYVATWAGGGDRAAACIRAVGHRIQAAAATMLEALEDGSV